MHIKELHIDGFGAWHDMRCRFDAPVTVVYGPNEAGKSTLLRFIRTMLYGFATRAQLPERGEPVRGGRHGGRLVLRDGDRELILERYADGAARRGGTVVLRDDAGAERTLTQAEMERLLLGGVSERLFRQLFAVTLDELHELRTLQGEEIGNYLYHAGMAGGAALTAAGKWLSAEMDRLYRPKGSTQTINLTLADMKALEATLRQSRQGIAAYREAMARLAETDRELEALEAGLPALREREAFLRGALEARSWWLDAEAARLAEAELAAQLPPDARAQAPLGEEATARWETLLRRRADAEAARKLAEEALAELQSERDALVWDEALVAAASRIETLDARREAAVARRSELAEVAADLRLLEEAAAAALQRVSPAWTEDDARRFAAMAEREEGGRLRQRLEEAERVRDRIEAEAQRIRGDQAAIQAELAAEEEASASPDEAAGAVGAAASSDVGAVAFVPRTREALLGAWHELEDELRELDRAGREAAWAAKSADATPVSAYVRERLDAETSRSAGRADARRRRASDPADGNAALRRGLRIGAAALAILGAAGGIAAFASGSMEAAGLYGALAAVLLAASGAALWLGTRVLRVVQGRAAPADDLDAGAGAAAEANAREAEAALRLRADRTREALARLIARPAAVAAALAPDGRAGGAEAFEALQAEAEHLRRWLRDGVQAQLDRWSALDRAQAKLGDIRRRGEAAAAEAARVERERQAAEARCGECRRQWQDWLAAWKLPERLAPESLPELGQLADQALQQLRQRARLAERAAGLRAELDAFEADAAALFAACPPPAQAAHDAALAVKLLQREAQRQREAVAEARRLEERLRRAEGAAAEARAALGDAEAAVRGALADAGAPGADAYELRLRVDERRRALRLARREAELRLEAGRDAAGLAELAALLGAHDEAALGLMAERARTDLADREAERSEALDRRGRLAQELERLRREAELEERTQALEECRSELDRHLDRYAMLALTAELIRRTKRSFEEERQPEVLRAASRHFAEMTGGAYVRIVAPGDEATLLAETPDRRLVDSSFLSRGTQEQMYLSLRLALAAAASPSQALPLLLDDLFVHFDADRLERAVQVVGRIARERQTLLFTCHAHVADAFRQGLPEAGFVTLPGREDAAAR